MNPFEQGRKAFLKGVKRVKGKAVQITNPFDPESEDYRSWEFGYNTAYFNNLERLNETSNTD